MGPKARPDMTLRRKTRCVSIFSDCNRQRTSLVDTCWGKRVAQQTGHLSHKLQIWSIVFDYEDWRERHAILTVVGRVQSLERAVHHDHHLVQGKRLLYRQHRTEHRCICEEIEPLGLTPAGHRDDANPRAVRQQLEDRLDPILLRHVEVGDDEIATVVAPEAERLQAIACLGNLVPRPVQEDLKGSADAWVIIHNQDPLARCRDRLLSEFIRRCHSLGGWQMKSVRSGGYGCGQQVVGHEPILKRQKS